MIEFYHFWDSFCSFKVRFALAEKGLDWIGHHVDLMVFENLDRPIWRSTLGAWFRR